MSPKRAAMEVLLLFGLLLGGVWVVLKASGAVAAWALPWLSPRLDISMGAALSQDARFLGQPCDNPRLEQYLTGLSQRLTAALEGSPFTYQFRVADSPEINAFALPGGFITVNYGLIEQAETGEEIAAVLAHEIQHVELRHSTRTMLRRIGGFSALAVIFGDTSLQVPAYLLANAEFLRYSREQEAEADLHGLELLVRASIRPDGLPTFFRRLEAQAAVPPELLSTHPDPGNRAARAEEFVRQHHSFPVLPSPEGLRCRK